MKYKTIIEKISTTKYLVAIVAIVAVAVSFAGARAYAKKPTTKRSNCPDTCVSIRSDGFSQSELAVKVGTFVEFRSADNRTHDLALGEGTAHVTGAPHDDVEESGGGHPHDHVDGTESGEFGPDEAWKVQFKKAGTYVIHDHFHPELNILVVAYEPSTHN